MFDHRFRRLVSLALLFLLTALIGNCATEEPATVAPTEEPLQAPTATEFTSPLPAPTATIEVVLPEPSAVAPYATVDLSRTPVAIVDSEIGPEGEVITIQNVSNEDRDISNWIILNLDSDEVFRFPDNLVLAPGMTVKVYSGMSESEVPEDGYFWREEKVWNAQTSNILLLNDITRLMYWHVDYGE